MEPILFTCEGRLAERWIEAAVRDGFSVKSWTAQSVQLTYGDLESSVRVSSYKGNYVLDLESTRDRSLRDRLERLLCASGAQCNIPAVFGGYDALCRCSIGIVPQWLDRLRVNDISVDSTIRRGLTRTTEFLEGIVIGPHGSKVRFTTGAAYDPVGDCACDLIEMDIHTRLIVREVHRQFVKTLTRELDNLSAVTLVLFGVLLGTKS